MDGCVKTCSWQCGKSPPFWSGRTRGAFSAFIECLDFHEGRVDALGFFGEVGLVFQLLDGAIACGYVGAFAEVDGLVNAAAVPERIEVANFDDVTFGGDVVVGWDGDVSCGYWGIAIEESEGDASFGVDAGDDEGGALDELELQLRAAGVGATRAEGGVDFFEDGSFTVCAAQFFKGGPFVGGIDRGADPAQSVQPGWDETHERGEAIEVAEVAQALAFDFEEVEGVELVADRFAIDEGIAGEFCHGIADRIRDGDGEAAAVDAGDAVALFFQKEASTIVLFL